MKHSAIVLAFALLLAAPVAASAQFIAPGSNPNLFPPPPPPSPPRKLSLPPLMRGETPSTTPPPFVPNFHVSGSRRSFGDRITGCLNAGAAAGLDPADRAAYSRSCATR